MKTITLMRHARPMQSKPGQHDLERPLHREGHEATALAVGYLKKRKFAPELIVSSHAVRAMETAEIVAAEFNHASDKIKVDQRIYSSKFDDYIELFFDIPDEIDHVLLVGHNPDIGWFANRFLAPKTDSFPVSTMVGIAFDVATWQDLPLSAYRVLFLAFPGDFISSQH